MAIEIRGKTEDEPETAVEVRCFGSDCLEEVEGKNYRRPKILTIQPNFNPAFLIALQHFTDQEKSHYIIVDRVDLAPLNRFWAERQAI